MKTRFARILFLLALAVPLPIQAQRTETEFAENHDGRGRWLVTARYERSYDSLDRLVGEITAFQESTDPDFWLARRTTWTYDTDGRPLQQLTDQPTMHGWEASERRIWEYTEGPTMERAVRQHWDASGEWQNLERTTTTFDGDGRLLSRMLEFWIDGLWQPGANPSAGTSSSEWTTMEYAGSVSTTLFSIWSSGDWRPVWRITESEQSGTTPSTRIRELWVAGAWRLGTRTETVVVEGGGTTRHDSRSWRWDGNAWIPSSRLEQVIDQTKDERTGLVSAWSGEVWEPSSFFTRQVRSDERTTEMHYVMSENGWESRQRYEWTRDSSGRISGHTMDVFYQGSWYPLLVQRWSYQAATAVEAIELPTALSFHVSPNPTSGPVTLHMEDRVRVTPRLEVFDLLGRPVTPTGAWDGGQVMDLGGLPRGVYFLRLRSEGAVETASVIVQ